MRKFTKLHKVTINYCKDGIYTYRITPPFKGGNSVNYPWGEKWDVKRELPTRKCGFDTE